MRELYEEMLVTIAPDRLLIHQTHEPSRREAYYFLASITAGTPTFNPQSEEALRQTLHSMNSYRIAWVKPDDPLLGYYPEYGEVATLLQSWIKQGIFPTETVDIYTENQ